MFPLISARHFQFHLKLYASIAVTASGQAEVNLLFLDSPLHAARRMLGTINK